MASWKEQLFVELYRETKFGKHDREHPYQTARKLEVSGRALRLPIPEAQRPSSDHQRSPENLYAAYLYSEVRATL